jgi:hypothetical protein
MAPRQIAYRELCGYMILIMVGLLIQSQLSCRNILEDTVGQVLQFAKSSAHGP